MNERFKYCRPDEVAECWDGVVKDDDWSLYEALWKSMSGMKPISAQIDIEESAPQDAIGLNTVASVWDRFTEDQQARLNELAAEQDREWAEAQARFDAKFAEDPRLDWFDA